MWGTWVTSAVIKMFSYERHYSLIILFDYVLIHYCTRPHLSSWSLSGLPINNIIQLACRDSASRVAIRPPLLHGPTNKLTTRLLVSGPGKMHRPRDVQICVGGKRRMAVYAWHGTNPATLYSLMCETNILINVFIFSLAIISNHPHRQQQPMTATS